jgi:hypothetical protein
MREMRTKYIKQDILYLAELCPSDAHFAKMQEELFGEGFVETLETMTKMLVELQYPLKDLHRHGVLLGILLAEQKHNREKTLWSDWE